MRDSLLGRHPRRLSSLRRNVAAGLSTVSVLLVGSGISEEYQIVISRNLKRVNSSLHTYTVFDTVHTVLVQYMYICNRCTDVGYIYSRYL